MLVNKLLLVILSCILVIRSGICQSSPPKSLISKAKTAKEFWKLARNKDLTYNYQMADKLKNRNSWVSGQALTFAYCAPYPAMYVLVQPADSLSMLWPPAVLLPRCSGYLFGQESGLIHCAPTKIVDDHIMVDKYPFIGVRKKREVKEEIKKGSYHHLMKRFGGSSTTVSYPVKVHVECREACIQNDKSCAAVGKIFDSTSCECKCNAAPLSCNIPFKLDHNCKCVCSLSDSDCNAGVRGTKYLNQTSCQCECKAKSRCLPPNILKKDDCSCIRPNIQARVAATTKAPKSASTCKNKCTDPKKPRLNPYTCVCLAARRRRPNSG